MPDDPIIEELRKREAAEKARHEELMDELRRREGGEPRMSPRDRLRKAYAKADDPAEVRRQRRRGSTEAGGGS